MTFEGQEKKKKIDFVSQFNCSCTHDLSPIFNIYENKISHRVCTHTYIYAHTKCSNDFFSVEEIEIDFQK